MRTLSHVKAKSVRAAAISVTRDVSDSGSRRAIWGIRGPICGPFAAPRAASGALIGVAVDAASNVYVADERNNKIRKISPTGGVSTLAGSGEYGAADGPGTSASFAYPHGLAVDASGNVYVADSASHRIRKVSPDGVVTTVAGTGAAGSVDGPVSTATFNYPVALALGSTANIYVAEGSGGNIRNISLATGEVSTLASGFPGVAGLAVTSTGTVYAAANQMQVILQISQSGVATVAGLAWEPGSADGSGSTTRFNLPIGIALGSTGKLYIADLNNQKIRLVTLP